MSDLILLMPKHGKLNVLTNSILLEIPVTTVRWDNMLYSNLVFADLKNIMV